MANFQLAKGVKVPNMDGIYECYEIVERIRPSDAQPYYSFAINLASTSYALYQKALLMTLKNLVFFFAKLEQTSRKKLNFANLKATRSIAKYITKMDVPEMTC